MTTFLLNYSDRYDAQRKGFPKAGTTVEIETLADLDALAAHMENNRLIITAPGYTYQAPHWAEYLDIMDEEACTDSHHVTKLPDGWQKMRWLEVYNGYRE